MKEADDVIAREARGMALACKPGCAYCCHQLVVLTCKADGEVILKTVKDRLTKGEFDEFARFVREQAASINAMPHTEAEKRRWPCPLLKDGKCLVYDVRPVACRSVLSTDSECCRQMLHAATYND